MSWRVVQADCVEAMAAMDEASVDAIVCDPPYLISFMGKAFDSEAKLGREMQTWHLRWAVEALRVLKPGGHLLAFGGTRTYHRLACAVEDAGFEVRDSITWMYGSGFPKSLDVSKAIDKAAGVDREVIGANPNHREPDTDHHERWNGAVLSPDLTAPATADAVRWAGWGTALKPASEPIVVARKPIVGTVAGNVLAHGTGALNVDGCRVGMSDADRENTAARNRHESWGSGARDNAVYGEDKRTRAEGGDWNPSGRWPANVVLSHADECVEVGTRRVRTSDPSGADGVIRSKGNEIYGARGEAASQDTSYADADGREEVALWACVPGCPVRALDEQTGTLATGNHPAHRRGIGFTEAGRSNTGTDGDRRSTEAGGASRFFYCAKASGAERNAGLDGFEEGDVRWSNGLQNPGSFQSEGTTRVARNSHPTVKPVDLMRWLVRLVTPPGGVVLDPFTGSGTTGCAAVLEGFEFVGVEREAEYVTIAEARIRYFELHGEDALRVVTVDRAAERVRERRRDEGQVSLFDLMEGAGADG